VAMQDRRALWLMLVLIVGLNTVAQTFLKIGANKGFLSLAFLGGVAAYGVSTLLYVTILGGMNLSFVYPVVIGATTVVTCLAGSRILNEGISGLQWLGIGLIIAGITFIALGRQVGA
jgi:small multidrug resistance pump